MKFAIRNRFIEVINSHVKEKLLHNDEIISEAIGVSKDEFLEIMQSKTFLPSDVLAKFLMAYPEIDGEWLLMGWDNMIKEEISTSIHYITNNNNTNSHNSNSVNANGDAILENNANVEHLLRQNTHNKALIISLERNISLLENINKSLKSENEALKEQLNIKTQ